MEPAVSYGLQHFFVEHQVFHVGPGNDHALVAGKALDLAGGVEAFDLAVNPPTGWISPFWLMEPVTAKFCFRGMPEMLERRAKSSAAEALSPSTLL